MNQVEGGTNPASDRSAVAARFGNKQVTYDPRAALKLYLAGQHQTLCRHFLAVLEQLRQPRFKSFDAEQEAFAHTFLKSFLHVFTEPDFDVPEDQVLAFLFSNETIANLVFILGYGNTDPWLKMLLRQQRNLVKLLTLYSSRNKLRIPNAELFTLSPRLASNWFTFAIAGGFSFGTEHSLSNHVAMLDSLDERFTPMVVSNAAGYLTCSYTGIDKDVTYKRRLNTAARKVLNAKPINNRPDPGSVAVVSGLWFSDHVVYRNNIDLVEWLAARYRLTLVHVDFDFTGQPARTFDNIESSSFSEVRKVTHKHRAIDYSEIADNDFSAIYYTDIGMVPPTIFLSNQRFAPIQITGYGHPVSTFGSEIDYFIGGADVEGERAQDYYSERLVLVPGLGVNSAHGRLLKNRQKTRPARVVSHAVNASVDPELRIACCWGQHKINHHMLCLLRTLAERSSRRLRFVILTAAKSDSLAFLASEREIKETCGHVPAELHMLEFDAYIEAISQCAFALDAYPFGGFNTIADILVTGRPVIAWEGHRAYNRLAAAFLRRVGLGALIATNEADYLDIALRLINDRDFSRRIREHIEQLDIAREFEQACSSEHIGQAIEYIIDNHETLVDQRGPILIEPR